MNIFVKGIIFFGKFVLLPFGLVITLLYLTDDSKILESFIAEGKVMLFFAITCFVLAIGLFFYKKKYKRHNVFIEKNEIEKENLQKVIVINSIFQIACGVFLGMLMWFLFCILIFVLFFSQVYKGVKNSSPFNTQNNSGYTGF